jgi:Mor family transcriptional regulator
MESLSMMRVTSINLANDAAVNLINELVRVIRDSLGLPEKVAVPMAEELAKGLHRRMGGLYIPAREIREARDDAVLRDFNGKNHAEVMRLHNISQRTLYRIIGRR